MFSDEHEGLRHAGQHPERQHVDLHEFERLDVVLVPFDHLPVDHCGGFDRHEIVEAVMRQDEAAWMLAQMPRSAHELLRKLEGQRQRRSSGFKPCSRRLRSLTSSSDHAHMPEDRALMRSPGKPSALPTSRMAPFAL